ncbi:hypothetical protein [Variovorax sp. dw_954]|uniref:hypothetical protein n=1 Tax=Variovorax sp. dw_954 TaxID=2720078 RepID=UPI001BD53303|nr:hypothetical protein [Variovorax sp. dw_954]
MTDLQILMTGAAPRARDQTFARSADRAVIRSDRSALLPGRSNESAIALPPCSGTGNYHCAMNFSTDEQRRESLLLLKETADYLKRLPVVTVTQSFIVRIEEHLAAPTSRLTLERTFGRAGTAYSPAGVPLFSARLVGSELSILVHRSSLPLPVEQPLRVKLETDESPPFDKPDPE